jgi:hypothetical protein
MSSPMPPPSNTSKASPKTSVNEEEETFAVSRNPDPRLEARELEVIRGEKIKNDSDVQDMGERIRYASHAYGITQTWIGFLIVITIAQFSLKPLGFGLSEAVFITVFTTTTASVFGFCLLVGQYLFRKRS